MESPRQLTAFVTRMRLMEGADIYQIAKNCRTSVSMIEKHYVIHLKNTLDASATNVLKPKLTIKKKGRATTSRADYHDDL
jgi:hypothetical protein